MIQTLLTRYASTLMVAARSISVTRKTAFRFVALAFLLYLIGTLLTVISTQRAADKLSDTDAASTLAGGEAELERLADALAIFDYRMGRLKSWLFPVRQAAKISFVFPPLDRQRKGFELLLTRIDIYHEVAIAALDLGRSTLLLRDSALNGSRSIADSDDVSELKQSIAVVKRDSLQVLEHLDQASTVGFQIFDLGVSGPINSVNDRTAAQESQLENLAEFSLLLSDVLLADLDLLVDMSGAIDNLRKFADGDISIGELSDRIAILTAKTADTKANAEKLSRIAPSGILDSEYGDIVVGLGDLNRSAHGLIDGINSILGLVAGPFENLAAAEGRLFDDGEVVSATFSRLIASEDELTRSVTLIEKNIAELLEAGESGPISIGEIGESISDRTQPLIELAELFKLAARIMGYLLGVGGEERTLILLGQNSDELRAAGGFTSNIWRLNFNSGALQNIQYIEVADFEDLNSLEAFPVAVDELELHMVAGRTYMRDVGWNPDFPSVGKLTVDLYEIRSGQRVDGVISLTQEALVDLVKITGDLEIDSQNVGADDLIDVIQTGTDDEGTAFLTSLFDSFIDSLSGERVEKNFVAFLHTFRSLFASKDLMIYTENPEIQGYIRGLHWDGELLLSESDRLAIVDSNVGWNKVDRNIVRQFSYEVDLSDESYPKANLTLDYRNDSVSADECQLQAIFTRTYEEYLHGCYWNYFRTYISLGGELIGGDSLPLPAGSVAVLSGARSPNSGSLSYLFDENGTYVSGLLTVAPGSERSVNVSLSLPQQVLRNVDDTLVYSLDLVSQAGAGGREGVVTILTPSGYEVASVSSGQAVASAGKTVVTTNLDRDETLEVVFRKLAITE